VIGELNTNGSIKSHFVYALHSHVPDYMINAGVKYKLVHDQVGSVRLVINSTSGAVKSKLSYDEFGILQACSVLPDFQPFGFAGGIRDSGTGLVRFGVRDYDPETGRWTSKDPIGFDGGSANLYGYVFADPINFIDPSGLSDINLFPNNERIHNSDFKIPNPLGQFTVGGHGSPGAMWGSNHESITPDLLAHLIRNDSRYHAGQAVHLNSCSTGKGSGSFAQQLANILNAPVQAPNQDLAIGTDGSTRIINGGKWLTFQPSVR
jgi:RHS repeat-associated protein